MGFACGKSHADASSPFSGKPFWGFPRKWASPSRSHYGKTKYGDKIAPCGRKKYIPQKETDWSLSVVKNPCGERIYLCVEKDGTRQQFFSPSGDILFIFCLLDVFGRRVGLFSGSPKGSRGNKRTWLPGMAASQTYKGRHKEVFWSCFILIMFSCGFSPRLLQRF